MVYFITGNKNKLKEAQLIIPELEQLDIDLPEIQSLDAKEIISYKLKQARKVHEGEFIVEDTALYIEGLNGLPGPLVKWFLKSIGTEGIYKIAEAFDSTKAEASAIIGYMSEDGNISFFEGKVAGRIVLPTSKAGFGWDPIFRPEGYDVSFVEMGENEKNQISHRGKAMKNLKEFLDKKS